MTTAEHGKKYATLYYALEMIILMNFWRVFVILVLLKNASITKYEMFLALDKLYGIAPLEAINQAIKLIINNQIQHYLYNYQLKK